MRRRMMRKKRMMMRVKQTKLLRSLKMKPMLKELTVWILLLRRLRFVIHFCNYYLINIYVLRLSRPKRLLSWWRLLS